jgi:hypothetical protein
MYTNCVKPSLTLLRLIVKDITLLGVSLLDLAGVITWPILGIYITILGLLMMPSNLEGALVRIGAGMGVWAVSEKLR